MPAKRGRPKGSKNKVKAKAAPIAQPAIKVNAPSVPTNTKQVVRHEIRRYPDDTLKSERVEFGKWPSLEKKIYVQHLGKREFSLWDTFLCGTDDGVLLVDYKHRHDQIPPQMYRAACSQLRYTPSKQS